MAIQPTWFSSTQLEFSTILDLPHMTSYDTLRCGGFPLGETPQAIQTMLLEAFNRTAKQCEKNVADLAKRHGNGASESDA